MKKRHVILALGLALIVGAIILVYVFVSNATTFIYISGVDRESRVQVLQGDQWRDSSSILGFRLSVFRIRSDQSFGVRVLKDGRFVSTRQGYGTTGSAYFVRAYAREDSRFDIYVSQFP